MQSVSSRTWTRIAVSISYDDNHYTTGYSMISNNIEVIEVIEVTMLDFKPKRDFQT